MKIFVDLTIFLAAPPVVTFIKGTYFVEISGVEQLGVLAGLISHESTGIK